MKINTTQASAILKVSKTSVRTLVKNGQLKNYATDKDNAKRKGYLLDMKEVKEYAKTFVRGKGWQAPLFEGNGPALKPIESFTARLDRIEAKVDKLLALFA